MTTDIPLLPTLLKMWPFLIIIGVLAIIAAIINHPNETKDYIKRFIAWYKRRKGHKEKKTGSNWDKIYQKGQELK